MWTKIKDYFNDPVKEKMGDFYYPIPNNFIGYIIMVGTFIVMVYFIGLIIYSIIYTLIIMTGRIL